MGSSEQSLQAVPDPAAPETENAAPPTESAPPAEAGPEPAEPSRERRTPWLAIVLGVVLLLLCLGYGFELQRAAGLEQQIATLEADLADARRDVRLHEERMEVVRGHVDDLVGRVELLQQAVDKPIE